MLIFRGVYSAFQYLGNFFGDLLQRSVHSSVKISQTDVLLKLRKKHRDFVKQNWILR